MPRLPNPTREHLPAADQEIWDRVWKTRGAVGGPQSVLMHVPQLGSRIAESGDYLRFHGQLAAADRELAMLTTGREVEARYEWQAHEPLALKEGVRPEAIEVVRRKGSADGLLPREQLIIEVVRALYRTHGLPDEVYKRASEQLGTQQLVELVALAGHYGLLGFILNAFQVDLPATAGSTF